MPAPTELPPTDAAATPQDQEQEQVRAVKRVIFGDLMFDTWFDSLYPLDVVSRETETLFVCAWCFRYHPSKAVYLRHLACCAHRGQPPGVKVYDDGTYSVWQVDGCNETLLAQNLSLFAKLFLDHKSVFFNVSTFDYFLLVHDPRRPHPQPPLTTTTDNDNEPTPRKPTYHILGYFSKEKMSWDPNNLACILIFPPYQHRQLGKLLMGVSYKLSFWEYRGGLIGGPERPLSEMGHRSYLRFWEERLVRFLIFGATGAGALRGKVADDDVEGQGVEQAAARGDGEVAMTIRDIGFATGMLAEDVLTALNDMGILDASRRRRRSLGERSGMQETGPQESSSGGGDGKPQGDNEASKENQDGDDDVEVVSKSKVLEWAIAHRVSLVDPVKGDAFIGQLVNKANDADPNRGSNSVAERPPVEVDQS